MKNINNTLAVTPKVINELMVNSSQLTPYEFVEQCHCYTAPLEQNLNALDSEVLSYFINGIPRLANISLAISLKTTGLSGDIVKILSNICPKHILAEVLNITPKHIYYQFNRIRLSKGQSEAIIEFVPMLVSLIRTFGQTCDHKMLSNWFYSKSSLKIPNTPLFYMNSSHGRRGLSKMLL